MSHAVDVLKRLKKCHGRQPSSFLRHKSRFQLLIATILSAQTTDAQVNSVTPVLFKRYPKPKDLAKAHARDVEDIIYPVGFYKSKAKHIIATSKMVVDEYGGKVPGTMDELTRLMGVARKTANIVLNSGFGRVEGIAVDTHVKRLSKRLGLSNQKDPDKVEKDLMQAFPKRVWGDVNALFITHGRKVCTARKPKCSVCCVGDTCPKRGVGDRD